jgi:branched-chain amino acid transport system permease protein
MRFFTQANRSRRRLFYAIDDTFFTCIQQAQAMDIFLQQLLNGLVLGSIYALVAIGYTMVYGVLGLINFAHGEVLMIGAMVAFSAITAFLGIYPEAPGWLLLITGLLAAIPVCMLVSFACERFAYRPLRNAPRLAPLISAIGLSIVLQTLAMMIWGRNHLIFPVTLPNEPITLIQFATTAEMDYQRTVSITPIQILIVVVSAVLMFTVAYVVKHTRLGQAMRATAQSTQLAGLMGIPVNAVIAATFIIGAALAGVAGVMVAANYSVAHFYMGFLPGLKAFTAAVLGGIGNIHGAMLGGLLLGMLESLGAGYLGQLTGGFLGSHYQDIFAFAILILVLTLRPSGLLGHNTGDRA